MSLTRWFILFGLWNLAAGLLFVSTHDFMEHPMVDLPLYLFILGLAAYPLLNRIVLRQAPASVGMLPHWIRGFHYLFWAEALMEAVIFTLLDFHNTSANDPFFMGFWLFVAVWFVGGWPWLARRTR